jgi:hypothetical protein
MPRYHFVVRVSDHTHDDHEGVHLPNHEAAREHGDRIVRELKRRRLSRRRVGHTR